MDFGINSNKHGFTRTYDFPYSSKYERIHGLIKFPLNCFPPVYTCYKLPPSFKILCIRLYIIPFSVVSFIPQFNHSLFLPIFFTLFVCSFFVHSFFLSLLVEWGLRGPGWRVEVGGWRSHRVLCGEQTDVWRHPRHQAAHWRL